MLLAAPTDMRVALSVNGLLVLILGIVPQYLLQLWRKRDAADARRPTLRTDDRLSGDQRLAEERESIIAFAFEGVFLHFMSTRALTRWTHRHRSICATGAVMIIPLLPEGYVVLERQFRYPLANHIEFPAGKIDVQDRWLVGSASCSRKPVIEQGGGAI